MNTRKYMFKNSLVACFACCCISFASAGNPPFFPTDVVTNAKGELLMTDKGVKRVDVFSREGERLLGTLCVYECRSCWGQERRKNIP